VSLFKYLICDEYGIVVGTNDEEVRKDAADNGATVIIPATGKFWNYSTEEWQDILDASEDLPLEGDEE